MIDQRLLTLLVFAEKRNFSKTAAALNITQPAVTQHIQYLEREYAADLVKKNGNRYELTQEGLILVDYAKQIELLYKAAETKLLGRTNLCKTYFIGASMTVGGYVLPRLLGAHKNRFHNIDLQLEVNNTEEILEKLLSGKFSIALVEGPFDKSKITWQKFKDDELVLVASPKHRFVTCKKVSIEELLSGELILREKGSGTRKIIEDRLMEIGCDIQNYKGYMEIGSISAIKALVELNLGYTIISRETVKKELEMGTLKIIPIKNLELKRELNFVYLNRDEFVREFIAFSLENMG